MFRIKSSAIRVVDGDTIQMGLFYWFKRTLDDNVRLAFIDTEEVNDPDPVKRQKAFEEKAYLSGLLGPLPKDFWLTVLALDKYKRPLAVIYRTEADRETGVLSTSINHLMLHAGMGKVVTLKRQISDPKPILYEK